MLVMVTAVALLGGIPMDVASLLLTLTQTLICLMNFEGGLFMKHKMMVGSGAHGVVQSFVGEQITVTSAV